MQFSKSNSGLMIASIDKGIGNLSSCAKSCTAVFTKKTQPCSRTAKLVEIKDNPKESAIYHNWKNMSERCAERSSALWLWIHRTKVNIERSPHKYSPDPLFPLSYQQSTFPLKQALSSNLRRLLGLLSLLPHLGLLQHSRQLSLPLIISRE
jgi:hypothetical protein